MWLRSLVKGTLPIILIACLYVACAALVDPRGEFPLNDDWSYTRSAFRMGLEDRMSVDEFSAPNLVGQALYGGLLVKVFGAGFLALRLSTLLLSCALACLLWKLFERIETPRGLAWMAVLSWMFNPIQFSLSFTYMTEVPFLFFIAVAALAFAHSHEPPKTWWLLACGAALGYAFLIRQTSMLFVAGLTLSLLAGNPRQEGHRKAKRLAAFAAGAGAFVLGYYLWAQAHGGSTPSARRKFELLRHLSTQQVLGNFFGLLFYLSFFLIPVLVYLLPILKRKIEQSGRFRTLGFLILGVLLSASGLWWFHARYSTGPYLPARAFHGRMPFLLNVLYDTGLGPVTLDPTYYGPPPTPVFPRAWIVITWLVAAGAVVLLLLIMAGVSSLQNLRNQPERRNMAIFSGASLLVVVLFEIIFSHLQEGGLFDRHILTAAFPLLLLICIFAREMQPPDNEELRSRSPWRTASSFAAISMLAVMAWFCITATHDYLAWNRLRWELGNELLAQKVDPLAVSGGFEFNGWHNYDTFRARGNIEKVYYWWYDRLDYLITMEPQEGYHPLKKLEYYSWLHRKILPVYLLQQNR